MKKLLFLLLLLLLLFGCTTQKPSNLLLTLQASRQKPATFTPTKASVAALPYFQIFLETSRFGSAILVLAYERQNGEFWATSSGQILRLVHGQVRGSIGFPDENLDNLRVVSADPFAAGLQNLKTTQNLEYRADWLPADRYGITIKSELTPKMLEKIEILEEEKTLLQIEERFSAVEVNFSGVNYYWVDPQDGFVFRTEQSLTPTLRLRLTQLRPYRSPSRSPS